MLIGLFVSCFMHLCKDLPSFISRGIWVSISWSHGVTPRTDISFYIEREGKAYQVILDPDKKIHTGIKVKC